jgi:hypothetical protein
MFGLAIAIAAAFVAGIGVSAYRAFRQRHVTVARAIAGATRVSVADFRDGASSLVVGKVVVAERAVDAPLTGKSCVYHRVVVEGPPTPTGPTILLELYDGVDFYVEDDSGRALISVEDAVTSLSKQLIDSGDVVGSNFERRIRDELPDDVDQKQMTFHEGRLDAGEMVAIRGVGRWVASPHGNQRGDYRKAPRQLILSAPLHITDRPFDGE